MPRNSYGVFKMLGVTSKKSSLEKGRRFELSVRRVLERRGYKEFSRPHDKHCDWICEDRRGNKVYVECKASPKAKFSADEVAYLAEKSKKNKVLIAYKDNKGKIHIVPLRKFSQYKKIIMKKGKKVKRRTKAGDALDIKLPKLKLW